MIQELVLQDHIKYSRWSRSLDRVWIESSWRKKIGKKTLV